MLRKMATTLIFSTIFIFGINIAHAEYLGCNNKDFVFHNNTDRTVSVRLNNSRGIVTSLKIGQNVAVGPMKSLKMGQFVSDWDVVMVNSMQPFHEFYVEAFEDLGSRNENSFICSYSERFYDKVSVRDHNTYCAIMVNTKPTCKSLYGKAKNRDASITTTSKTVDLNLK